MSLFRIVALDGSLSSDFGWAIPIVEEAGVYYLMGETPREGWERDEMARLVSSEEITLVHPVEYAFDADREDDRVQEIQDFFACRSFGAPIMGLYWVEEELQQESIDVVQLTRQFTSATALAQGPEIRLLPLSKLIPCLREVVNSICWSFRRELATNIRDYPRPIETEKSPAFAKNGHLQWLATMAYRLAPDSGWAKEAIAQKTLLLMNGDHTASMPAWLSAVAPFWGHSSALRYWQDAANGVWAAAEGLAREATVAARRLSS